MTVYQGATLITVNGDFDVIEHGTLAVEGEKIVYAGPYKEFPGAAVQDCTGRVIIPGFVNGHCHMPMQFFRGYSDDMSLQVWLNERIFPLEDHHTPMTQYHGAQMAALEMIRTGTTTVNDMYLDGWQTARALKEAGLSGIVCTCLMTLYPDREERLKSALELAAEYKNDPLIRTSIGPHAEYTCDPKDLERWSQIAYDTNQPIHIHCSETITEHNESIGRNGLTPVGLFNRIGMLKNHTLLAHCVHVSEEDMDIIKETGASVLHNPCSNLKLASGFAPVPRMIEKGLNISLSTDSASSNNTLDMWEEMRVFALIHKGNTLDPLVINAKQALYYATKGSALALGYADRGSLEEGMRADFLVVSMDEPAMSIPTNPVNLVVYSGNSRDIVMTVAGGKVLYSSGCYTTLDRDKIVADCRQDFATYFAGV